MYDIYQNNELIFSTPSVPFLTLPNGDIISPLVVGTFGDYRIEYAEDAAPSKTSMTFAQLLIGLVSEGWITESEGEAWLQGILPQAVLDLIATLPESERFAARARATRPSVVERFDPLVVGLAAMQNKSENDLNSFFATYG